MIIWRRGTVRAIRKTWGQAQEVDVLLHDGETGRALVYLPLVGNVERGDELLLSASAVARGLGTGGYLIAAANATKLPEDPPPQAGHIMKARYTPSQFMVQGVDEQESPYHDLLAEADSISGMPVVVTDLHSALPAIVHAIHDVKPTARIAYIMLDGGALPAWFSQLAAAMRDSGAMLGTISCGQAFGGELEAVNVYTALLAAKLVWNADIAVVTQGPGNLGTGTKWGFSGTQVGEALNAVGLLGGVGIAALRMSQADQRQRHLGISHHSTTALGRIVTQRTTVVSVSAQLVPLEDEQRTQLANALRQQLKLLSENPILDIVEYDAPEALERLAACPCPLRTMGRGLDEDALSFVAAYAAGHYAATNYLLD